MKYVVDVAGERHELTLAGGTVEIDGQRHPARIDDNDGSPVRTIRVGDAVHRIVVRRGDRRGLYTIWVDGFRYELSALDERTRAIQDLAAAASGPRGPAPLVAPMPGLIVRVNVAPGDKVAAGAGLIVMEAMKMENELRAPAGGTVKAVHAQPGTAVEKGSVLVELE
jgi:acetyl/propionyl-CoA carboxylase alpha subunit